jgi:hypothetical protein
VDKDLEIEDFEARPEPFTVRLKSRPLTKNVKETAWFA